MSSPEDSPDRLEKTRFSITRLKPLRDSPQQRSPGLLKRQDSRLRDWNYDVIYLGNPFNLVLKRQDSRLRDWNIWSRGFWIFSRIAWKDKILDYEIETPISAWKGLSTPRLEKTRFSITRLKLFRGASADSHKPDKLEKTRFSITRLKLGWGCGDGVRIVDFTWKDKILDYEIETWGCWVVSSPLLLYLKRQDSRLRDWNVDIKEIPPMTERLEKTRFSITRLKLTWIVPIVRIAIILKRQDSRLRDWNRLLPTRTDMMPPPLKRQDSRLRDWNAYFKDTMSYSIVVFLKRQDSRLRDWNFLWCLESTRLLDLKRQDSRLRDWNCNKDDYSRHPSIYLKRQDSRLRDWNSQVDKICHPETPLPWKDKILDYEIETHIAQKSAVNLNLTWKDKILDYEIETKQRGQSDHPQRRDLKRQDSRLRDWNS